MTHEYTEFDFGVFKQGVDGWMRELGMTEWKYEVKFSQVDSGTSARVSYNCVSKKALFQLSRFVEGEFGMEVDPAALAQHEVLHLLLSDYCWLAAKVKDDMNDVVVSHEHEIINRLMRAMRPPEIIVI